MKYSIEIYTKRDNKPITTELSQEDLNEFMEALANDIVYSHQPAGIQEWGMWTPRDQIKLVLLRPLPEKENDNASRNDSDD